jgi:putative PIN family toxin of toxin-antitoxin system
MPVTKKRRVILDTNLWISFLLTNNLKKIDSLISNDEITLIFSQELIGEFIDVATRPKFKKYFTLSDLERLLIKIKDKAEFVEVTTIIDLCRDEKDNFLLALSIDGKATHLITGDKDLLTLNKIDRTIILTISEFFLKP